MKCANNIRWLSLFCGFCIPVVYASAAQAQQAPGVGYVFPAGGKAGTTVAVKLGGYDWTPDVQFFVHDPRVKLEVLTPPGEVLLHEPPFWLGIKSFANDAPLPREVSARFLLPADLTPGPIRWRVANANGGSNCGVFIVGVGHEVVEDERRRQPQELSSLPVTVSGRLRRIEEVDRYRFKAARSGPVTCELMARGLGSDFHGVLEIRDAQGRKLADVVDTEGIDPALTFFAGKNEEYTIDVHDLDYRGYRSFTYRLTVTPGPRVLAALPAAGRRGETRSVEFVGIGVATGRARLESVTRTVTYPADGARASFPYRLETPWGTAPDFLLFRSDLQENVKPNTIDADSRRLAVPTAVTGLLARQHGKDRYSFMGKIGEIWNIAAEARRLGSSLDLTLTVLGPDGKELAANDDLPGTTDAGLSLTLPVDGVYEVVVADASGTKDLRAAVYRLAIERAVADFQLVMAPMVNVPLDGKAALDVKVIRAGGFKGSIALAVAGLPPGVIVPANLEIQAAANSLAIPLQCGKNAPAAAALVRITGVGKIGARTVTRSAQAPTTGNLAPREPTSNLVSAVLVATTLKPPFKVKPVEADGGRRVHRGATHLAELIVQRDQGYSGEIVLDMAAVQSRHRQGIRGPALTVARGRGNISYPVFLPEGLETARTSRLALVAMAKMPDPSGTERYVLASMEGQITMSIEGALMKLSHTAKELTLRPGQPFIIALKLARSSQVTAPASVELIVPAELAGLIKAAPLAMPPNQETAAWRITTQADARLLGNWNIAARATALKPATPLCPKQASKSNLSPTGLAGQKKDSAVNKTASKPLKAYRRLEGRK